METPFLNRVFSIIKEENKVKKLMYLMMLVFVSLLLLPRTSPGASALPKVPITYPGDTEKTIARRAQWIEGARKEGAVVWWGSDRPDEIRKIADEFNKVYPFIKLSYWRGQDKERETKVEAEHALGRLTV